MTDSSRAGQASCCSDPSESVRRRARAQRLVAVAGASGLAVVVVGLVVGGWPGAVVVGLFITGLLVHLVRSWRWIGLNDKLIRIAVVALLAALAVVRAFPR
ncbi:hypothetical protein [Austwickia chelonae]|uniref:hypothetical protein n=1 Tax=Austwickia chelonae TaxID=100225 RepID=UPI0013C370AB|nr:hypothetical protein [Austwickia chelonae]